MAAVATDHENTDDMIELAWRARPHTFAHEISNGRFQMFRWVRYVGNLIAQQLATGRARMIFNLPPRVGKSELLSIWTPIWILENLPMLQVMLVSHGDPIATEFGRKVRNQFDGNPKLLTRLREDSMAAGRWNTPEGGGMYCTGIGGSITGRGFNLGIVEDPIKDAQEANSSLTRDRHIEWFQQVFYDRAEPDASIIVVMHRWHEEDLSGWLLEHHGDDWTHIKLPAIAEENDSMGRALGEALCPERYDVDALSLIRGGVGVETWASKFQQRPESVGADRVYSHFNPAVNLNNALVLRNDLPLQVSVDFNIDPGMHVLIGQHDERADVFTSVYEIHGPRMTVLGAVKELEKLLQVLVGDKFPWPELHVFGDPSGKQEWAATGESQYQILLAALTKISPKPPRRRVTKGPPPVVDRVNAVNDALCDVDDRCHFQIHPRCTQLVLDLKSMRTGVDGLIDKRDRNRSHASDAEGYRIHYLRPLMARIPQTTTSGRFSV